MTDFFNGEKGEQGVQGIQGPQGIQGLQGNSVNNEYHPYTHKNSASEFASVYSTQSQTLNASPGSNLAGQAAVLERTIYATSNIDVSQAASNGKITVNLAGWYDVATGICGELKAITSPLPVWTLSLFVNGTIVPGSTVACMTISPEQKSNATTADVFVHLNKGDVLELSNTSMAPISLSSPTTGTYAQPNSAYMKLKLLKAD